MPDRTGEIQRLEEPGRPDFRTIEPRPGHGQRIAIPVLNIHKTRLNDPLIWFMGTNDQPGDYRQSGCAGCHVVYANDRDPLHSAPYAQFGQHGTSQPSIRPFRTRRIRPSAQHMLHARHSDQPVHDLPHAPAEHVHEHACSATRCGITSPTRRPCGRRSSNIRPTPNSARFSIAIPKARRCAANGRDVDFLRTSSTAQSEIEGHAVRRLPRPRLEFPRRVSSAIARATCSTQEPARSSRTTIRTEVQEGRAHALDPHGQRHAMRGLPFRAGQSRQRLHLRRGERRGRDRLQGLPRHCRRSIRHCTPPDRPHRRPARICCSSRNPDGAALRVGRRQVISALAGHARTRMARWPA